MIIKTFYYLSYMHNKNLKCIHCCKCNGAWKRLTCLPATLAHPFSHFMVTGFWEVEPWRVSNTVLPRMALPKLLFPMPAQPSNTSLSWLSKCTHTEYFCILFSPCYLVKKWNFCNKKQDLHCIGIICWNLFQPHLWVNALKLITAYVHFTFLVFYLLISAVFS